MAPSVTSWWRLEARARDPLLADALEARIADPLWLLGRQWQTGEFQGVDAGTPVNARARLSVRTLGWYRPAGGPPQSLDLAAGPLDALVEREAAGADLRLALTGGRRWVALLAADAATITAWIGAGFGIGAASGPAPDPDAERLAAATAGRALDGAAIHAALVTATENADFSALPGSADAEKAARAYIAWWEARAGRAPAPAPAWQDARMEYEFAVATSTGDEAVLTARGHRGGTLDWPAFDSAAGDSLRPAAGADPDHVVAVALPSPVTFKGMPAPRWWQFEDAAVSFPAIDAAPDDLARLIALEFALIYGNDHFVVPVRLPVGTLSEVDSLVVEDSFGFSLLIDSTEAVDGAGSEWHMFKLAADARGTAAQPLAGLLLTAPTIGDLEGPAIEDVLWRATMSRRWRGRSSGPSPATAGARWTARWLRPSADAATRPSNRRRRRRAPCATGWRPRCRRTGTRCCRSRPGCARSTSGSGRSRSGTTRPPRRWAPCSDRARRCASRRRSSAEPASGSGGWRAGCAGVTAPSTSGSAGVPARVAARARAGCASTPPRRTDATLAP